MLQLEELAITGEEHVHPNSWAIGLSTLPDSWSNLRNLRTLQLQGHTVLEVCQWTCKFTKICCACNFLRCPPKGCQRTHQHIPAAPHEGRQA